MEMIGGGDMATVVKRERREMLVAVSCDASRAYQLVLAGASEALRSKSIVGDPTAGLIVVATGVSLRTFGDAISIQVSADPNGRAFIWLKSRPQISTTLTNWGKTRQDFRRILSRFTLSDAA